MMITETRLGDRGCDAIIPPPPQRSHRKGNGVKMKLRGGGGAHVSRDGVHRGNRTEAYGTEMKTTAFVV